MLSHGGFAHCNSLSQNPISKSLLFPTKPHLNFVLNQISHHKLPSFHGGIRTGFYVFASKTPKKIDKPLFQVEEIDDDDDVEEIDDDDDDDDDVEEIDDDGDDDDEEYDKDELLAKMLVDYKAFVKSNKGRGFGEDKVYDTSLEDKLFAEIEPSKTAQVANLNKLKNSPQKQTAKEASPSGVSVRLRNLPRKKNIERDLKAAFKEFPGILNIVPAVNGNKKTKEPSCKGHAFVYFKSQNEANRFVEVFSEQILTFGKIQQKINCVVVNPSSPNATDKQADKKLVLPLLPLDPTNSEDPIDEKVSKTRLYTGILDNFTSLESIDIDSQELKEDSATDVGPLENNKENEAKGKIVSSKRKGGEDPEN